VTVFRTFFDESAAYLLIRATAVRRDQQMQADTTTRSKNRRRAKRGAIHGIFSGGAAIAKGAQVSDVALPGLSRYLCRRMRFGLITKQTIDENHSGIFHVRDPEAIVLYRLDDNPAVAASL
jgi:hypothetical protein